LNRENRSLVVISTIFWYHRCWSD